MARILFCCINGVGLGHVTRVLAIARQVRRLAPDSELLVLTSSENAGILWNEGIASIKVPSYQAWERDRRLPAPQLANALTAQTVATFRPDAVVVEAHTVGTYSELLSPVLNVGRRIFVFDMQPQFFEVGDYRDGLAIYQRIIVPYREDEKDSIGVTFGDNAEWVGDILVRSANEILPRETARRRLRLGMDDLVFYVGLGGGGLAKNEQVLTWVLEALADYPSVRVACAAQPLSTGPDALFRNAQVTPVSHYPMVECFAAFDAAIASAGGHCAEYVQAGIPMILVPLGKEAPNQDFHAERFASKGFAEVVEPFDSDALRAAVETLLDAPRRERIARRMRLWAGPNGAETAAQTILNMAGG